MPGSNGLWQRNPPPKGASPVEHLHHRRQLREEAAAAAAARQPQEASAEQQLAPGGDTAGGADGEGVVTAAATAVGASVSDWHWHTSHVAARASRVKLNDVGGLAWPLECEDMPDAHPQKTLSDPYVDNYIASQQLHYGLKPLMIITRTDNSNTVMYACKVLEGETVREPKDAIDLFWYDVEPKTTAALRKKGHRSTRTEFAKLDNFGYGLDVKIGDDGVVTAAMGAMPSELKQKFRLVWVEGEPRFEGKVNGVVCHMEKLYIETKKRSMNPIPKIMFVRVWGTAVSTGEKMMQEVVP
jgi:hypothetical protein